MADSKVPPLSQAGPAGGAKLLPIEADMLARATGQQAFAAPGVWFGPGEPLPTQAPENVKGRRLDYPFALNTNPRPRGEQGENAIDFGTLRRMSDPTQGGLDLLRIAIETVKDRMAAQKWTIKGKDGKDGGDAAKRLEELLQEPDGVNDFHAWSRMIWDDHLVIDQPAIYLRPTSKGYSLPEVLDGGTIKRIVSESGRTPLPPLPAYAQQLKGMAAVEYTTEELIVQAYNPRTHRIYPMGPVEQVINIVNLWLRRQLHQMEFYTAGSIPDGILVGPEGLNPDQLEDFQNNWNSVLSGNTEARRMGRWAPFGTQFLETKQPDLTGATDEWLARVVCWAFSLSPQALVKEQNRATAETAKETSLQEGQEPRKLWFRGLMNRIIRKAYGTQDLQFAWQDEEITDALTKMQVWTGYKNAGIVDADEVRTKQLGMEPQTEEQKAAAAPPPALSLVAPGKDDGKPGVKPGTTQGEAAGSASQLPPAPQKPGAQAKPAEGAAKVQKKKSGRSTRRKKLRPIARERAAVKVAERKVRSIMLAALSKARTAAVKVALNLKGLVSKAAGDDFANLWSDQEREKLRQELEEALAELAQDGAAEAFGQIIHATGADAEELAGLLEQANDRAIAWAGDRAAELVGLTRDPETGDWIENPNPRWSIEETTREGLRNLVEEAEREGWTNRDLADAVEDFAGFDEARCDMIARTETAFADIAGNLEGWKATGQVEAKQWITGQDEVCEDCLAMEGKTVPLGEDFEGGDPPLHPNCRCDLLPVLTTQEDADE